MTYALGRTADELTVGDRASVTKVVSETDIYLHIGMTGDLNPLYVDEGYAAAHRYADTDAGNACGHNHPYADADAHAHPEPDSYVGGSPWCCHHRHAAAGAQRLLRCYGYLHL